MAVSHAPSQLSRASTLIGRHAQLGGLAADKALVRRTLAEGIRIVSASMNGGYGNAGAWGLFRRISLEEFQKAIVDVPKDDLIEFWKSDEMRGVPVGDAAAFILENGDVPLWHIVIEDMLRPKIIISTYFVIQDVPELLKEHFKDHIFDLLYDEATSTDLTAVDLEQELLNVEPLLEEYYNQAKPDSKWKGQVAYIQQPMVGRKTMLNAMVGLGRSDLMETLLKFTHEGEHGSKKPWLVLADIAFSTAVLQANGDVIHQATVQADLYGNSAFHCCAYDGKTCTLRVLLDHLKTLGERGHHRFRVLLNALAQGKNCGSRWNSPETALEVAHRAKNWACYDALKDFLEKNGMTFHDPLTSPERDGYVRRELDNESEGSNLDLIAIGACHFLTDGVHMEEFNVSSADGKVSLGEVQNAMERINELVGGNKGKTQLRIKGFVWRDETIPGEFVKMFLGWCLGFQVVTFTMSELSSAGMQQILVGLTDHLLLEATAELPCTRFALGIRPVMMQDGVVTGMLSCECIEDLLDALCRLLPVQRRLEVNIHHAWGTKLSRPNSKYLLGLFGCLTPILDFGQGSTSTQKGKGKSAAKNPLAQNPFMPGLCRVKTVAFDGNWRTLCGAQRAVDAVSAETRPFVVALCSMWDCAYKYATKEQQAMLKAHLEQVRRFIRQMSDLIGGETIITA